MDTMASWIFLPGGLLMPSAFPRDLVDKKFVPEDSEFDIQVRARVESHLTNFLRDYMEPLDLEYSEIEATPHMDYNFRFYCRKRDFAVAIAQTILEIDAEKFKPLAERKDENGTLLFEDGVKYHSVLNAIWSNVTRLGEPGGSWGAYSSTNPNGYKSADEYYSQYGTPITTSNHRIGSSFGDIDDWYESDRRDTSPMWANDDDLSYTPKYEDDVADIVSLMKGIPVDQWEDFLSDTEWRLVERHIDDIRAEEDRQRGLIAIKSDQRSLREVQARQQRRKERRRKRRMARHNR